MNIIILKITKIEIVINTGREEIHLHTNFPSTYPMIPDQGNMQMSIGLQTGTAIKYAKKNFINHPDFPATAILIDGKTGLKTVIELDEYHESN